MSPKPIRRLAVVLFALAVVTVVVSAPAAPRLVTAMIAYVQLQPSTPGVVETGHLNISGKAKSGSVETGAFRLGTSASAGSVLTANASGVGTWQAPYFPVPYVATSSVASGTVYATNTATTGTGRGRQCDQRVRGQLRRLVWHVEHGGNRRSRLCVRC